MLACSVAQLCLTCCDSIVFQVPLSLGFYNTSVYKVWFIVTPWTVTCQVPLSMRCHSTSIYRHLHPKFKVTYDDCFDSFCGSACGLHEWLLLFILTGLSAAPQNLCQLLSCSPISGHPPTSTPPHHPLQTSPEGCGVTSCLDLSYHS